MSTNEREALALQSIDDSLTVEQHLDGQFNKLLGELDEHAETLVGKLRGAAEASKRDILTLAQNARDSELDQAPPEVQLAVRAGPYSGKTWRLRPRPGHPCLLGRSTGKAFRDGGMSLPLDAEVSTTHAKLHCLGLHIFFTDMGSTNGSKINGYGALLCLINHHLGMELTYPHSTVNPAGKWRRKAGIMNCRMVRSCLLGPQNPLLSLSKTLATDIAW
jgi:hypothetical protein